MTDNIEYNQLKVLMECKGEGTDIEKYINKLLQLKVDLENNQEFNKIFQVFKAFAEKNRYLIFQLIAHNDEMCICELQTALKLTQSTISHHLQKLEEINLIEGIKRGKFIHYRLKKSEIQDFLKILEKIWDLKPEEKIKI